MTVVCGQCDQAAAVYECEHCSEYFCEPCSLWTHKKGRMTQHRVYPMGMKPAAGGASAGPSPNGNLSSSRIRRQACSDHPEDEVTYFCLDCEGVCVCTECVVHGRHKNHDVQIIRRAYGIITQRLENLLLSLGARMEELTMMEQKIESHRKEILDNTLSVKDTMSRCFGDIRDRLRMKEEELMENADVFMQNQLSELDLFIKNCRDRTYQMDETAGNLRIKMESHSEADLLNYYADMKGDILDLVSGKKDPLTDVLTVANRKCFLDMDAANHQIEALHGLHLTIATLRGPQDDSVPTAQFKRSTIQ